ncbi:MULTISPECIES: CRISPR-associated endonuclease Cas2 [unclassified Crossiella]|uniref:CRISPR-associated endonuclease Cas2 n=1 Tax=unclassified Crossiella TaxID=2620835 RepID=UPI001FFEFA4C|nr:MULTISPECIES: CRISPR-associated endonuclease Cas2 [unclassified Crossiella]MCK2245201.1 CRISPR-associated endonuclease Cas2 [Crossiella sp. S99.2]MCK2258877.1 CRISPR-associated endonuclease Cas2 [Crossiella sp. S99.1]
MYVIAAYDTASERNPQILRTCRKYLHHSQNSVFEGPLTPAQLRLFQAEIQRHVDPDYDRVLVWTLPPGAIPERQSWGQPDPQPDNIL